MVGSAVPTLPRPSAIWPNMCWSWAAMGLYWPANWRPWSSSPHMPCSPASLDWSWLSAWASDSLSALKRDPATRSEAGSTLNCLPISPSTHFRGCALPGEARLAPTRGCDAPLGAPARGVGLLRRLEVAVGGVHARPYLLQRLVERGRHPVPVLLHAQVRLLGGSVPGRRQLVHLRLQVLEHRLQTTEGAPDLLHPGVHRPVVHLDERHSHALLSAGDRARLVGARVVAVVALQLLADAVQALVEAQ